MITCKVPLKTVFYIYKDFYWGCQSNSGTGVFMTLLHGWIEWWKRQWLHLSVFISHPLYLVTFPHRVGEKSTFNFICTTFNNLKEERTDFFKIESSYITSRTWFIFNPGLVLHNCSSSYSGDGLSLRSAWQRRDLFTPCRQQRRPLWKQAPSQYLPWVVTILKNASNVPSAEALSTASFKYSCCFFFQGLILPYCTQLVQKT